jgi:hypothetical protein
LLGIGCLGNLISGHIYIDWEPLQRCERRGYFSPSMVCTECPDRDFDRRAESGLSSDRWKVSDLSALSIIDL